MPMYQCTNVPARAVECTLDQAKIIVMPVHVRATKVITSYYSLGRNAYGKYIGLIAVFLLAQRPNTEHKLDCSSFRHAVDQYEAWNEGSRGTEASQVSDSRTFSRSN